MGGLQFGAQKHTSYIDFAFASLILTRSLASPLVGQSPEAFLGLCKSFSFGANHPSSRARLVVDDLSICALFPSLGALEVETMLMLDFCAAFLGAEARGVGEDEDMRRRLTLGATSGSSSSASESHLPDSPSKWKKDINIIDNFSQI